MSRFGGGVGMDEGIGVIMGGLRIFRGMKGKRGVDWGRGGRQDDG